MMEGTWMRLAVCMCLIVVFASGRPVQAQGPVPTDYERLIQRLDAQEAELAALRQEIQSQDAVIPAGFAAEIGAGGTVCVPPPTQQVPVVVNESVDANCAAPGAAKTFTLNYMADYDKGFVIRPIEPRKHPFELKVNGWIQFRHHGFASNVTEWTDNAGVIRPVRNRNAFDVERGRLVFSGYAVDPRLSYFLHLDGDTDNGEVVDFFDYWWGWEFSEALQVQVGKRKVPGSRQWLLTARRTRLIDRPLSTDFFRPDRTTGVFAVGDIGAHHYELMAGNGFRTSNLDEAMADTRFGYAATTYWDPLGDFGNHIVDFEGTSDPVVRVGHSFTYAPHDNLQNGVLLAEADFVRLSDGTRLTQPHGLRPGFMVTSFDLALYSFDVAAKWCGWSINAELYLRWLQHIEGMGIPSNDEVDDRGFYVEGGKFLIPKTLDVNVRYSQVSGAYGDSAETAAGVNWYPLQKDHLKLSFDVSQIQHSALNSPTSDILVGDDGVLFRTQFQAEF